MKTGKIKRINEMGLWDRYNTPGKHSPHLYLLQSDASAIRERPAWGNSQWHITLIFCALDCHLQESCNESHTPGALKADHEHCLQSRGKFHFPKTGATWPNPTVKPTTKNDEARNLLTLEILLHQNTRLKVRAPTLSIHFWKGSWT